MASKSGGEPVSWLDHVFKLHNIDRHRPHFNFRCDVCHKFFKTAKAKVHHQLLHAPVKNFACDLCGKQFARKFQVDNHLKYYCEETRHTRTTTGAHRRNHNVDGKVAKRRVMTTAVISTIDSNLSPVLASVKKSRTPQTFVCDLCGRCYTAKTSLLYHQTNHHQEAHKVQCPICSAWYDNDAGDFKQPELMPHVWFVYFVSRYVSKYIKRHIAQHSDTSVMCDKCHKPFKNEKNLKAHMKNTHLVSEAERRLACNICEKRFLYPFHLKVNLTIHPVLSWIRLNLIDYDWWLSFSATYDLSHGRQSVQMHQLCQRIPTWPVVSTAQDDLQHTIGSIVG